MATKRDVSVVWVPSVSTDVVSQELTWSLNGEVVKVVNLAPDVNVRKWSQDNAALKLKEGDEVTVQLVARDEVSVSEPVSVTVKVPVVPPLPVTGLVARYEEDVE